MGKFLIISILSLLLISCNFSKKNDYKESPTDSEQLIEKKSKVMNNNSDQNEVELSKIKFQDVIKDIEIFSKFELLNSTIISNEKRRALLHIKKDSLHIILLEKLKNDKSITRQITDTIHFISDSEQQYTNLIECENVNNPQTEFIFAFYNYEEEKEYFDNIAFAWKVDLLNDKLLPVDTTGIRCLNISYLL
ncbi:hypothetical protein [Psychroflexus aestuariivivens]|uniref:hypothetical protein n=1 Tax=Psychroflexus aestuariivivens TaxID=1795040 RepID=UPI000FD9E4B7|nr:hypothetical protein [Psychroflexus aestuariivivens]